MIENEEFKQDLKDLKTEMTKLSTNMIYCLEELKGINFEQKFARTIFGEHRGRLDNHDKDLDGLHKKVDKVSEEQNMITAVERIHVAAEKVRNGESEAIKITLLKDFTTVIFPKILKHFWPLVISGLGLIAGTLWEFLR